MSVFSSIVGSYTNPFWKPPNTLQNNSALPTASTIQLSSDEQRTIQASRARRRNQGGNDELANLKKQTNNLTREIQFLLDAQAIALTVGRDHDEAESQSDRSVGDSHIIPIRQPREKPMGLNAARKGITRAMRSLASTKNEEIEVLNDRSRESQNVLHKIDSWESRRRSLENDISNVRDQSTRDRMVNLELERSNLSEQIDILERQLWELKSQHRAVEAELSTLENAVQSKLSSYSASLALIDTEVKQFLDIPPRFEEATTNASINDLPKDRRTLEILKDSIQDQSSSLKQQKNLTKIEKTALEQGMELWSTVLSHILDLESNLRSRIRKSPAGTLDDLKDEFEKAIQAVEHRYQTAENNNWNLLLCCIGAELDALRKGQHMIFGTDSGLLTPREGPARANRIALEGTPSTRFARPSSAHGSDGPGADLLVSHDIDE